MIANANTRNQQLQQLQQQGKRKRKDKISMDINVVHATTWISLAWNKVKETTIKNCFSNAISLLVMKLTMELKLKLNL